MNKQTKRRAHTPPYQADGVPVWCAVQAAFHLAKQDNLLRVALWVGHNEDVERLMETAMSRDVLELVLREGSVAVDGLHFELRTHDLPEKSDDVILLAICVDHAELESVLDAEAPHAAIFVPRTEEDLQLYLNHIPDSEVIGWTEQAPEPERISKRTEEMSRRIAWYNERYRAVTYGFLGGTNGHKHVVHDQTGRCRYCGKSTPEVTFGNKSHAFPEQIGNKTLIDPAECDTCNKHFSKMVDDDFAKWTQPWRTVLRVHGSSGIPTTNSRDRKMKIEASDATNLKLSVAADDEHHSVDTDARRMRILIDRPSYVPMGVFKCMVKMALSVMPDEYSAECSHLKTWILEKNHTFESYPYRPLNLLLQLIPGPPPKPDISYSLLRRKSEDSRVPYMMFVLQFANAVLQIALPMHEQDEPILKGEPYELLPFPHIGGLTELELQYGRSELRVVDMSDIERVRNEVEPVSFQYSERIELVGSRPG